MLYSIQDTGKEVQINHFSLEIAKTTTEKFKIAT